MEALEAILSRRSIRRYTDEPVSETAVTQLLRAACAAPSANNQQPWTFVVIDERELLDAIPDVHPYARMSKEAPLVVLVCGLPERERHPGYWEQDCAAATQNLLLAAHAQGLGAVWCGVHPREQRVQGVRELLGIPAEVVPFALIVVGHPAEEKPPSDRYSEERVHRNGW